MASQQRLLCSRTPILDSLWTVWGSLRQFPRDLGRVRIGRVEAPTADAQEALLIGTTLGSAPASAQRRIQQSLLLAQDGDRSPKPMMDPSDWFSSQTNPQDMFRLFAFEFYGFCW